MSSLTSRMLIAAVLAPVAVYAVLAGGWVMVALALVAGITAMHEFCTITRELRPLTVAGLAGVAGIIVAIHEGGLVWSLLPLLATLLLAFWLSAVADVRQPATVQIAVTLLGVGWIGYGLGFLIAIRDIAVPDGWGKSLLLAVLLGVWSSDIAAFFGGRLIGRRKLAREISPNKTVEGLLVGLVVGTAVAFIPIYNQPPSDPVSPLHALELAVTIAVVAPVGDLFESYMKRDAGVKDTGRLLGGHGGMLDRVDALLFAGVAAYFVALAAGRA